ncbi:MAG: hypothetical protein EZS28_010695 [Streblomastix strix]|uniref:Uncharacterized protein n=1 Tax=Streblomastix strix TaxID=222440 RepID=A0A5J4WGH0_9EUKA|nr:MAG: hypothetical protein EZS28_010695 [Streblomastix strix]
MPNSKEKRWKDSSRIAEGKRIFKRIYGKEFDESYQGFNLATDIDQFIDKEQINVHVFTYGDKDQSPSYYAIHHYQRLSLIRDFNVLLINNGVNAHILYVSDVQALTGYRYCDICKLQAFKTSNPNINRDMKRHMEKCKKNNGKIVKKVILEKFARSFVPHILSNITYRYLFVNDRENEFKPTKYYITYDIETFEKYIQQNYGEDSTVISYLIPYCIASTFKNKSGIHSFRYDIRQANFLDQWLDQVFEEAKQIKKDNKYEDESIPQNFEVPAIGFNSAKFDVSLVSKNLKSKNWKIVKHIGSGTVAKQIIVRHKDTHIQLRFVDALIYCTKMKLKEFVRDIGGEVMTKGRFPYEYIYINNYATELDKSEPFPREAFENKLKNKSISEAKYQEYLVEAAKYTSRWDYLRYYNIQDTRIMIEPIDNLIKMMFKYKIDMLAMFIMSQCANAIKYSSAYDDFTMNGDYNIEDTDKSINITMPYWTSKVESYIEQDQKKNRDSSKNVTIDDYEYFKELFEKQRCYICNCKFTWKNRPTLDRINNELGHSKDNVFPCLTTFSKHEKFNGFVKDFMQQRADAKSQKNDGLATFQIADNLHAVQVDSEYSFDQTKMHIVQLDTDSLTLAISGDKNRGHEQRFDAVIKDVEFYNKNKGFFFSEDNQRKILGVHIEKQGLNFIDALESLHIDWKSIWKIIYEAGIKYACESKLYK